MTTRKPKLNLLYADLATRQLQLAVVTPSQQGQRHARHWQAGQFRYTGLGDSLAKNFRKH
jgi:hypothetical protein